MPTNFQQYELNSIPRHLRYAYLIDDNYEYKKLYELICRNQKIWGGRLNPIIPVFGEEIGEEYLEILKYFDPDYIFYSKSISLSQLYSLKNINPIQYIEFDDRHAFDIKGVSVYKFLANYDSSLITLKSGDIWRTRSPLLTFYELNFGISTNAVMHEIELTKKFDFVEIDHTNFNALNQILHQKKPINIKKLSSTNLNTTIIRPQKIYPNNFELIIGSTAESKEDLLYYWNRQLFSVEDSLYITREQLELLKSDRYFGGVLYDLSTNNSIDVTSFTLNQSEVEKIINDWLNPIALNTRFQYKSIDRFPYEILDGSGLDRWQSSERYTTQSLMSNRGLFHIPNISFASKHNMLIDSYAVDLSISEANEYNKNLLLFPTQVGSGVVFASSYGRINKNHEITIKAESGRHSADVLNINIQPIEDIVRRIMIRPDINSEETQTGFSHIRYNDSSKKLRQFFKLFNNSFELAYEFITDKFWFDLFSDLSSNSKLAGDSINLSELKVRYIRVLESIGGELGVKGETWKNEENLEFGLIDTLTELCEYKIFLKGFVIKCPNCSSKYWYHLDGVGDHVTCIGCLEEFITPIEMKFEYKLNDLIKNNLFQKDGSPDGNLTVIRTLLYLFHQARNSFDFAPQINIYDNVYATIPIGDIDIFCIVDGKLIIGEAKHSSKLFFEDKRKSLETLLKISEKIRPDSIIISSYINENNKLEKAEKSLQHFLKNATYKPEIIKLDIGQPHYHYLDGHRYFRH